MKKPHCKYKKRNQNHTNNLNKKIKNIHFYHFVSKIEQQESTGMPFCNKN